MIRPGLCSVTFRHLPPEEIIRVAVQAGLEGIQWGSDVHVPADNPARASEVRRQMDDAGLVCDTYGTYYRTGLPESESIEGLLENAGLLGARSLRIWAGIVGSAEITPEARYHFMRDLERVLKFAESRGITLVLEFHGGTLTDSSESTVKLLQEVGHPFLKAAWQPLLHLGHGERVRSLESLLPWLDQLHVFHWQSHAGVVERMPLADGTAEWRDYLNLAANRLQVPERWAYLEFVREDVVAQLLSDARTLSQWLLSCDQRLL